MTMLPREAEGLAITAYGEVGLRRWPVPEPGPDEVVIETWYSGVSSGTELWVGTGQYGKEFWGEPPFVPGYQSVGRVVATGAESTELMGEMVAAFAIHAHRRYQVAPMSACHVVAVSDRLPLAALFVQPSVAANALNLAGVEAGSTVVVAGQGLVGQATAMLAMMRGAYVIASEVSAERIDLSRGYCADQVLDVTVESLSSQLAVRLPGGADVVVESTGFDAVLLDAIKCVRPRGTLVFEGFMPADVTFPFLDPHRREVTAVFPRGLGSWPVQASVLRQIFSGSLDLSPLVTERVNVAEAAASYARLFTSERHRLGGMIIDWRETGHAAPS